MRAVLFNNNAVRLGEVDVSDATLAIEYGGGFFGRVDVEAVLDDGGVGVSFQQSTVLHITKLDAENPRRSLINERIDR